MGTWVNEGRSSARQVCDPTSYCFSSQIRDFGVERECPKCHQQWTDNSNVPYYYKWYGPPAGFKFDPSDVELLGHLAAKCGVRNVVPHVFIDKFIPTIEDDEGICHSHPGNLRGVMEDGSYAHFFHRTSKAYSSGPRKQRTIRSDRTKDQVLWVKTGTTKPIFDTNGVQIGCKKVFVLRKRPKKGSKQVKLDWVMHQYHLGSEQDEKEGDFVISKIRYQPNENKAGPKEIPKEDENVVVYQEPIMAEASTSIAPLPDDDVLRQERKSIVEEAFRLAREHNLETESLLWNMYCNYTDDGYQDINQVIGGSQLGRSHESDFILIR